MFPVSISYHNEPVVVFGAADCILTACSTYDAVIEYDDVEAYDAVVEYAIVVNAGTYVDPVGSAT